MIQSIIIKNVASYNEAKLEPLKKINLIYGLNGAGKTILSNYLKDRENESFKDCEIQGLNDEKILVYNQKFIEENFYSQDNLKGIFTLSKANAEVEKIIKNSKETKEKLSNEKSEKEKSKNELEKKLNDEANSIKDKLWKIKTSHTGGDRILDYCFEGVKSSKDKLFEKIKDITKGNQPTRSLDDFKKELSKIEENAQEIPQISLINIDDILEIEKEAIFGELIVGNENSVVSTLIKELENFDWVKQGFESYVREDSKCPFCQHDTITQDLKNEFEKYFDKVFKEKMQQIQNLSQKYSNYLEGIPNRNEFLENIFIKEEESNFINLYSQLYHNLKTNEQSIKKKINNPSTKIILQSSQELLEKLNSFLVNIQKKIDGYNEKIKNKKEIKENLKNEFWQIMRWQYDDDITGYEKYKNKQESEIKKVETDISNLQQKIKEQDKIILENQAKTINIENTIISINQSLKDLGLVGFTIEKYEEKFYRIVRNKDKNPNFKFLSEGEKMIISFLYFLELCKGKTSKTEEDKKKVIVIDDPISSLSHNHIFNVAQLIKQIFFSKNNEFEQIFVLTHNLYFFNELRKIVEQKYKKENKRKEMLSKIRILKDENNFSSFNKINDNEILNDYQAYWQILKDFDNQKGYLAIIPNTMRNILEHFFTFVGKDYKNELNNIKDKAFLRYINRESHSDSENLSDTKDIDVKNFAECFKQIFTDLGYEEHYNIMMK
ncbi:AAA family ATPase [uncultured Helicobacter sp.]|uniref:AAA family ATPase n=1 Tax=uncultured Helicobacter sp. TaxID=175537 RepID=UPI002632A789|nr:AAA family ATPase [uncultured Helicobacter sp.]